jgi:hypothetical protein
MTGPEQKLAHVSARCAILTLISHAALMGADVVCAVAATCQCRL